MFSSYYIFKTGGINLMNEKTKETALEILQEMQKDKCVELSPDNLYFNKMCLGCKRNCITCIGFSLSCMIDNVIAVTEHASADLWYTLDEYKKCRRFLRKRKKLNNGSLDVPFDNIEVIKSVCDIFNSHYSKMSLDDIMKIRVDITEQYFNSKKKGRVDIDGFELSKKLSDYITTEIESVSIYDLQLIGIIVTGMGLHGLMVRGGFSKDKPIVGLVRSMAMVNDTLMFNMFEDKISNFQELDERTVIFNKEQVEKAMYLPGYKTE